MNSKLRQVLFIIRAGVVKTPNLQQTLLYQSETLHITFLLMLTIRKPLNFSDPRDLSQ